MRRLTVPLVLLALLACCACFATQTHVIPLESWSVVEGSSSAEGDDVVLRADSPVEAPLSRPIVQLRAELQRLDTADPREVDVRLTLTYDDGLAETRRAQMPPDAQRHLLAYTPRWASGRVVQSVALSHGQDDTELRVLLTAVSLGRRAVTMATSALGGANLHPAGQMTNDILLVRWNALPRDLPFLTDVRESPIRVIVGKTARSDGFMRREHELLLIAEDEDGDEIATLSRPIDGNVQTVTFSLEMLNRRRVERLVFDIDGAGIDAGIRQIVVGNRVPRPLPPAHLGEIDVLNDRLEALIMKYREDADVPLELLLDLTELLRHYRELQ